MFISLLPDTNDFNKTREWAEVRNALTSLGEDVSVVKIPGSTEYAGDVGMFDNYRCLIGSGVRDALNIDAYLKLNKVQSVFSGEIICSDNYSYDWRTNILWVNSAFNSYHHFFETSNTEVRFIDSEAPVRQCLVFGVNGDCILDDTKLSSEVVNDLFRRYFCCKIEDDLRGIILTNDGFVYDHAVSEKSISDISNLYKRAVKVDLSNSGVRLNRVAVNVIG